MQTTIKSVHFDADDLTKQSIEESLHKIDFAADRLVSLDVTMTKEKDHTYEVEGKIHFRWGKHFVVKATAYDLSEAIHDTIAKVASKVHREVERVQDHSPAHGDQPTAT